MLGTEAAYAGTSFLTHGQARQLHVRLAASSTSTADATIPGGLGTFGFDDEGVPAQRTPIVRDGLFMGLPDVSRDGRRRSASASNGAMRADRAGTASP